MPIPTTPISSTARVPMRRQVYDTLLADIVSGRLAPGQRLVEQELAESLGTSRTPVREAFHRLAAVGLVDVAHRQQARVAPLDDQRASEGLEVASALLERAVRRSVPHLTPEDDERLRELRERDLSDAGTAGDLSQAEIYTVFLRRYGNATFERIVGLVAPVVLRHVALREAAVDPVQVDPRSALVDAALARDADAAVAALDARAVGLASAGGAGSGERRVPLRATA